MTIDEIMRLSPVIPVLTIENALHARPIAQALLAGGLSVIEVTLRTPAALDAIHEIVSVDGVQVGAGTVLNISDLHASRAAGARFVVSPGLSETLVESALECAMPILPGVATASDIMRGLDLGLNRFKFFPAEFVGGIGALKALSSPFKQCRFCPTGGITESNARDWLALDAVVCVGGSWIVPSGLPDTPEISRRAQQAARLRKAST
jgi:2-dehydro-3-deoxyphosphogluconate aldolase/(4S)-4-hydroxy-2-oxoglutarate aldolase